MYFYRALKQTEKSKMKVFNDIKDQKGNIVIKLEKNVNRSKKQYKEKIQEKGKNISFTWENETRCKKAYETQRNYKR